jgi:glycosyltransferase involved in cell wall biosynthesis
MKISVALCTYNGKKFLRKQIDSILNQTTKVDEIVVCDDCSTDSTLAILEEYKKNNPEIFQIHQNKVNLKSNKNFEKAIALCNGDYIFLSDQDDIWRNDKVEKTIAVFNQNPEAEGVFSDGILINDKEDVIYKNNTLWDSFSFYESKIDQPIDLFDFLITHGNYLTGATLCIRKEVKSFCFPFMTMEDFLHDEWLASILTKKRTLFYTTEKLISYRLHDSQQLGIGDKNKFVDYSNNVIRVQKTIVKTKNPKSYKDYKILTNLYYSRYERLVKLKYENSDSTLILELINAVIQFYTKFDLEMKEKHPIRYFFRKRKDKMKGKRQIDIKLITLNTTR